MHNQLFEARVNEAFAMAMEVAGRSRLPHEVRKDVAQITCIEKADCLTSDTWREVVGGHAFEVVKRLAKEHKEHEAMKEKYIDPVAWERGNAASKEMLRELAADAMTQREWQIVHRRIWLEHTEAEIGVAISISQQRVSQLYRRGIDNMRMALRRFGVTKDNWYRWYYEGKL